MKNDVEMAVMLVIVAVCGAWLLVRWKYVC